jgi:hypothetical protein
LEFCADVYWIRYIVAPSGERASNENEPRRVTTCRSSRRAVSKTAKRLTVCCEGAFVHEASTRVLPSCERPPVVPSRATRGMP